MLKYETVKSDAAANLAEDENLAGLTYGFVNIKIWHMLLVGFFAVFFMRYYYLVITDKRIYFYRFGLISQISRKKLANLSKEYYNFEDISSVKITSGLTKKVAFRFKSNKKMKLRIGRWGPTQARDEALRAIDEGVSTKQTIPVAPMR